MLDFAAIRNTAFDDLLILRQTAKIQSAQAEAEKMPRSEFSENWLIRLDVARRTEALCRTQDLHCHLLSQPIEGAYVES